jgi:D-alanine transaminase
MSRIAYVNGRYCRHADAAIHIEDRGFQFADAVYEVWALIDGRLADMAGHITRLERSLAELEIDMPMSRGALLAVLRETVRQNRVRDGLVYLQVSRGQARRDHFIPDPPPKPTVVITVKAVDPSALNRKAVMGAGVMTAPDNRWGRCDIKTVGLLPNILAKTAARRAGCAEVWYVDADGLVTEGGSTNAWIIDAMGRLRTRSIDANILRGVTRANLLDIAMTLQIPVEEKPFTIADVQNAQEAFFTAASAFVTPVTSINGISIGDGRPGPVALRLRDLYMEQARENAV